MIFAPVRSSRSRSESSVEKKSWVVVRTSSPSRRVTPPYIVAMPMVVLSVSAYCEGVTAGKCRRRVAHRLLVGLPGEERVLGVPAEPVAVVGDRRVQQPSVW